MRKYPFDLLDDCHIKFNGSEEYQLLEVEARSLLTYQRFDLYANLIYIDHKVRGLDMSYAIRIYKKRTEAITGGKFSEPGNDAKNDFQSYVDTFNRLIESFQECGFDASKSLIPVDKDNILIDGAHRLSCAAYFGQKVSVIKFFCEFQKELAFPSSVCVERVYAPDVWDAMAMEYCKWHTDSYVLFVWPKVHKLPVTIRQKVSDEIAKSVGVVYHKTIRLHYNGVRNLILQIYRHVPWMGTIENRFRWSWIKADEVYAHNGVVEVFLVKGKSLDEVIGLKQRLRDICDMGLGSVHSTDNHLETITAAGVLFNSNSIHHIEKGMPDKFPHSFRLLSQYGGLIKSAGVNPDDYVVDSSVAMALYGIRDACDLDYLTTNISLPVENHEKEAVENHEKEAVKNHEKSIVDLIYNPTNYFIFNGLKIIALKEVKSYKKNRGTDKDKRDVALIQPYLNSSGFRFINLFLILDSKRRIYGRILNDALSRHAAVLLHKIGLYYAVRWCYRKLRR